MELGKIVFRYSIGWDSGVSKNGRYDFRSIVTTRLGHLCANRFCRFISSCGVLFLKGGVFHVEEIFALV